MERFWLGWLVWDGWVVVEFVKIDGIFGGFGVVLSKLYDWVFKCEIFDYNRERYM